MILNNVRFLEGAHKVKTSSIPIKDVQEAFDAGLKVLVDNNSFIPPSPNAAPPRETDGDVTKGCIEKLKATGAAVRKTEAKTQFTKAMRTLAANNADASLTVKVDLSKEFGPSASGKTIIIVSTEGSVAVPERDEKIGLNIYVSVL